ncbi:MAG: nickel-dependent hydrogenase large subunit [Candidatus Polarisedimenticolaceae bacterium]|nr:nickel-dependent hydrogenase large subunit [Candidatus Polarisedimenticolaceae bacterium]
MGGLVGRKGLLEQADLVTPEPGIANEQAWIDVIQKMDLVCAELLHHQVALEKKNAELEQAQQFITAVLSAMTDVLMVCDTRSVVLEVDVEREKPGRASDRFLSYGSYPQSGEPLFVAGIREQDESAGLNSDGIQEDLSHAWMQGSSGLQSLWEGVTRPVPPNKRSSAYAWCKAPRLDGNLMEVGALTRLLEMAILVPVMEEWVDQLQPGASFCTQAAIPDKGRGYGMIEAARGSLGQWLKVRDGRIENYQIIAPTTWNFSPRDQQGVPGPLEQALVGAPVEPGETEPVAVQHIVRSFDPCMVCTVH